MAQGDRNQSAEPASVGFLADDGLSDAGENDGPRLVGRSCIRPPAAIGDRGTPGSGTQPVAPRSPKSVAQDAIRLARTRPERLHQFKNLPFTLAHHRALNLPPHRISS